MLTGNKNALKDPPLDIDLRAQRSPGNVPQKHRCAQKHSAEDLRRTGPNRSRAASFDYIFHIPQRSNELNQRSSSKPATNVEKHHNTPCRSKNLGQIQFRIKDSARLLNFLVPQTHRKFHPERKRDCPCEYPNESIRSRPKAPLPSRTAVQDSFPLQSANEEKLHI